ncbi:hypothetical protein ACFVWR_00570 [Leifsonia sp. NPDC058292]|uniref:hypothetical protein n=1 Tax=Leifsonia sp. NPDC058292 TaxID=3346428 RepID=UPI0036DD2F67
MRANDDLPAAFRVRDARAAGVGTGRLRGPSFQHPFYGMRSVGLDLDDHLQLCRAAAVVLPPACFFSHHSAAVIHGLPLPWRESPREVEVSVFEPARPPELHGVIAHQLRGNSQILRSVDGLRVLGVEDTWAQLSSSLSFDDLVVIGDLLITGTHPYDGAPPPSSIELLEGAVKRHGRRRGVRPLRLALDAVRYGSLSPQESRLRLALTAAGLPEPALNHPVTDSGRTLAMIDLAYPQHRVAVEYLGDHHRTERETYRADIRRELLVQLGWNVILVTAADDFHAVALRTRRALLQSTTG